MNVTYMIIKEIHIRFIIVILVSISVCCYTKLMVDAFLNHTNYKEVYEQDKDVISTPYNKNDMYNMDKFKFKDTHLSELTEPNESMVFYKDTEHSPLCCTHMYNVPNEIREKMKASVRTTGCACLSKEQEMYLNTRGGNHLHTLYEDLIFG